MKTLTKTLLIGLLFLGTYTLSAQHRELGFNANVTMSGFMYGPMFDARPILKFGKSFNSLHRIRMDRTTVNYYTNSQGSYLNVNTGIYLGHEWRKPITDKIYFVNAPEIGGRYFGGTNYSSQFAGLYYNLGVLYRLNERFNISLEMPINFEYNWAHYNNGESTQSMYFNMFNSGNLMTLSYSFK